jgi:hypothetical protein
MGAAMDDYIVEPENADPLGNEISDAAIERAAGLVGDGTASLTISFCSGLDYCPPH